MSYLVLRTDTADEQIRDIVHYLSQVSGSPEVALGFVDKLEEAVSSPSQFPRRGAIPHWGALARQGFRYLTCGTYLVLYKTDEQERTVTVHAIVNGRREYWKMIGTEA
jgi:toxin ParE1/3/4